MLKQIIFVIAIAALVSASAQTAKNDYADGKSWLCRPGRQDACTADQATTIVAADGTLTREEWKANPNAPIDCFYVYPTVSTDPGSNSDMIAGAEENGVVLIGHSQGSGVLTQLMRNEIDGKPVSTKFISALLLGTSLEVPKGKDVGGAFQHIPLCHSATHTGCVIAYASFRSTIPPPENSRFGRVQGENMQAACVNPAALGGGSGALHSYLASGGRSIVGSSAEPRAWVTPAKPIDTPFVSVPGLLTAQCVEKDKFSYLEVTVHGNPADSRADDIVGDVMANGQVNASWGLHLVDVNLAMGNLVDIVGRQGRAFLASGKKSQ